MSRIEARACCAIDMEWYAVDRKGQVAVFCSAGKGNLPEFVCADEERADSLIELFERLEKRTDAVLIHTGMGLEFRRVARDFSERGLFYFDSDDASEEGIAHLHDFYTRISDPTVPLLLSQLPENIRALLEPNRLDVEDFSETGVLFVKHAY